MDHALEVKIYYEDTDCGNVVYYANYLKYMERGRTEYLAGHGFNVSELAASGNVFRRCPRRDRLPLLPPVWRDHRGQDLDRRSDAHILLFSHTMTGQGLGTPHRRGPGPARVR